MPAHNTTHQHVDLSSVAAEISHVVRKRPSKHRAWRHRAGANHEIPSGTEAAEMVTKGKRRKKKDPEKLNVFRGPAGDFVSLRCNQVPEAGVEPALDVTLTGF